MNAKARQTIVLVFAPSAYPLGGVQTWLDYLLPGLREKRLDVRLALTESEFHNPHTYLSFHPALKHIPLFVLKGDNSSQLSRLKVIKSLITKVKPDVCVTVNMVDVFQAVNELRSEGKTETRLISTLHGVHAGMLAMLQHYRDQLDSVISTNRLTQALVTKKAGVPQSRSLYAPYGVEPPAKRLKAKKTKLSIAYVGRFEEDQKRVDDLLTILSLSLVDIDNLEIHLAGDSEQPVVRAWMSKHQQYAKQIIDHGVLTPLELVESVYKQADILLLTSEWETGPIVAWEAMAHQLTLVCSRYIGSQHEGSLVHQHNCLMFDIGDCKEALKQIKKLQDTNLRHTLNANALSLVEQKYTCSRSISSWYQCIEQTLALEPLSIFFTENIGKDKGRLNAVFNKLMGHRGDWAANLARKIIGKSSNSVDENSDWPHSYRPGKDSLVDLSEL